MNTRSVILAMMVGIMAFPAAPRCGEVEDRQTLRERREAMRAMLQLVQLSEVPSAMRQESTWLEDDSDQVVDLLLVVDAVLASRHPIPNQPPSDDPARHRRSLAEIIRDKPPPAVPDLQDKDLTQADREIPVELEGPKPRPPAASGESSDIRLSEMYTSLGNGWSEGAPGKKPPVRSTQAPGRRPAPPSPTPADFEQITREAASVYQESVASMQQNVDDWRRRQDAIHQMHEAIEQTGDVLRQQQDDWHLRHPELPVPPPAPSKPPPATTSKPPSETEKSEANSSGGHRRGSPIGGGGSTSGGW